MYGGISHSGMGSYRPRVALVLFSDSRQSAIGRWGSGSHTVERGIDREELGFRPRKVGDVKIPRGSESGMGPYRSRKWQDRGGPPRGNSRRAGRVLPLTKGGWGGALDQGANDSENAGIECICQLYKALRVAGASTRYALADKKDWAEQRIDGPIV